MSHVSLGLRGAVRALSLGLVVGGLAWSSVSSAANISVFTNQALWAAAAGSPIALEDFADATLVPGLTIALNGGGSISGGQINNALAVQGICVNGGTGCGGTTIFSISPGTTAFGADWDLTPGGSGSGIQFYLDGAGPGASIASITNPSANTQFVGFFGFVSDVSFSTITLASGFTGSGETFNVDNVQFRTAGDNGGGGGTVPEPATLGLLALAALLGFSGTARRRS